MGNKFCNINIFNPEKKKYTVSKKYRVLNVIDDWDTIVEKNYDLDFGGLIKLAKELSHELDLPVFSVTYFDDDIFELHKYYAGKKVAYHVVSVDGIFSKRISEIISTLCLSNKDAKAFRYVVKNERIPAKAILKLSTICGVPFGADRQSYEHTSGVILDKAKIIDEIEKENAKNKIVDNNQAELLIEISGAIVCHDTNDTSKDLESGIIRVVEYKEDGIDYGDISCFQVIPESQKVLNKVSTYHFPFEKLAPGEKANELAVQIVKYKDRNGKFVRELMIINKASIAFYNTTDEEEIEKYIDLGVVPDENLRQSNCDILGDDSYRLYTPHSDAFEPCNDFCKTDSHFASTFTISFRKIPDENIVVRLGKHSVRDIEARRMEYYVRLDFYDNSLKYLNTFMVPYGGEKQELDLFFSDYNYIKEKNELIIHDKVINFNNKTITEEADLPLKSTFIDKRTIAEGNKILVIGHSRHVKIFNYDYKLIKSYSIIGKPVMRLYDEDDLYLVTATKKVGCYEDTCIDAKDKIRVFKIRL